MSDHYAIPYPVGDTYLFGRHYTWWLVRGRLTLVTPMLEDTLEALEQLAREAEIGI